MSKKRYITDENNNIVGCYEDSNVQIIEKDNSVEHEFGNFMKDAILTAYEHTKENEGIINPSHYCDDVKYQAWDVIKDWDLDFDLGCVVKYISRAGKKNGESIIKDLKKAQNYLNHEIEYLESKK